MVSAHADYLAPLRFGELFTVTLTLGQVRRSWFELTATLTGSGDGACARMALKLAAVSAETGKSVPLSPKVTAVLGTPASPPRPS